MAERRWRIERYDGKTFTIVDTIAFGTIYQDGIVAMLQRLCSKHMADQEIILASLPKGAPGYSSELEPNINTSNGLTISVGSNPIFFVAKLLSRD